jgi:hypothetical protein
LEDAARVLTYGSQKYAAWNWAKGQSWSVVIASMLRHIAAMQRGEEFDAESGLPHTGHILCNALFLATFRHTFPEGNDFGSALLAPVPPGPLSPPSDLGRAA